MTAFALARSARHVIQGDEFGEDVVLVRESPGEWGEDDYVPGERTETPVRLASAPLTGRDQSELRQVLSEGARLHQPRKFWIVTADDDAVAALRVGDAQTGPDLSRYRDTDYRVTHVVDYSEHGFVEVVATCPDGAS